MLIAPAVVTFSWLQQKKRAVKREVKWNMIAGIDKSELVFFKFSKVDAESKLEWEHNKEFEYNHEMYDVVEKKVVNDSIYLWCWWDYKETQLNKKLDKLLAGVYENDSESKEKQDLVNKFYKSIYFESVFSWFPFIDKYRNTKVSSHFDFYQSLYSNSEVPPPNSFLNLCNLLLLS